VNISRVRRTSAARGLFRGLSGIKDISVASSEREARIMSLRLRYACRIAGYRSVGLSVRKRLASLQKRPSMLMLGHGKNTFNDRGTCIEPQSSPTPIYVCVRYLAEAYMILRTDKRCWPARHGPKPCVTCSFGLSLHKTKPSDVANIQF